jgi:hypothetical protein
MSSRSYTEFDIVNIMLEFDDSGPVFGSKFLICGTCFAEETAGGMRRSARHRRS